MNLLGAFGVNFITKNGSPYFVLIALSFEQGIPRGHAHTQNSVGSR
jgi:hypothetical protein